jgi:hypothetical protein
MRKSTALIKERDGLRGQVPARSNGIRDRVYGEYLRKLNPRDNEDVQKALAASPDPRFNEFLERVSIPKYKDVSMQAIAKACNIDLLEFQNWWNKESTQRAIATAQMGSIKVTQDMVQDAMTSEDVCPRCDGLSFVAAPEGLPDDVLGYKLIEPAKDLQPAKYIRTCPKCNGEKTVRKVGDAHARDKVLEMAGILKKEKGAGVTINFGGAAHPSAISDLDKAMAIDLDN